jgi:hypothetical protein
MRHCVGGPARVASRRSVARGPAAAAAAKPAAAENKVAAAAAAAAATSSRFVREDGWKGEGRGRRREGSCITVACRVQHSVEKRREGGREGKGHAP